MFCTHCGNELKDGSRFCNACGAPVEASAEEPLAEAQAKPLPDEPPAPAQTSFAGQMESDRQRSRKKLSPLMILVIVLALLAATALAAVLVTQQAGQDEQVPQVEQGESATLETEPEPEPEPEPELTEEERVIQSLNGWWQGVSARATSLGYIYFHDGMRDSYTLDGQWSNSLTTLDPNGVRRHENGLGEGQGAIGTPGYFIEVPGTTTREGYYLEDSSPNTLSLASEDGSFYSGTDSLARVEAPSWAESVVGRASDSESNGEPDEAAIQRAIDEATAAGKQVLQGTLHITTYADRAHAVNPALHDFDNDYSVFEFVELDEQTTIACMSGDGYSISPRDISTFCLNSGDFADWAQSHDGEHVVIAIDEDPTISKRHWFSDTTGVLADAHGYFSVIAPAVNSTTTPQGATASTSGGDYLLADSATRIYSRSELEKLSNHDLFIARNEIYARHGRKFKSSELQQYFGSKSWYHPTIEADAFADSMLGDIELANARLMLEIETARGSEYI